MAFITEKEKKKELKNNISNYMKLLFRRSVEEATPQQLFQAVSYAVKDIVVDDWMATHKAYEKKDVKTVYYLSMEFLMGRALGNMIINLKEDKVVREVLDEMGVNLDLLEDEEPDAALGNGGLGRLAACFLDSLSTLGYPAYGCGIRYKYGMFKQKIENGFQIEAPDDWLKDGNPFEMKRPEYAVEVRFGGYVTVRKDEKTGRFNMVPIEGSEEVIPADVVLIAAGFLGSEKYVTDAFHVALTPRTNVETKPEQYATSVDRVFTAGDMHRGQSLVVWAIHEGREAAKAVDESLMSYSYLQ